MSERRSRLIKSHDAGERVIGSHFTMLVESRDLVVIADNVALYVVMQNHGPGLIVFSVQHGLKQKLVPGGLWATPVVGDLAVGTRNGEPAHLEIAFVPKLK